MNQILQVEKEKSGPIEIHKIALFFAISCIVFGLILAGQGIYGIAMQKPNNQSSGSVEQIPNVSIDKTQENLIINVVHTKPISKILYHWNNEEEQTIETNGLMSISEEINLPFGTNTLYLTIVDDNGNQTDYSKEYVLDGNGKPVIELLLTKDNKIRIKVQDTVRTKIYSLYME